MEFTVIKHHLSDEFRAGLGLAVAVIIGVAVTAACRKTSGFESANLGTSLAIASESPNHLAVEGFLPELGGAIAWLNSAPLSRKSLRGKVVLVDIWTYSCINSLRQLPYLKAWAARYKDQGLVVIGVHTPEFGFEKEQANVAHALRELNISYPVAIDSNHAIWDAFNNQYWPADYLIDAKGRIRYHHFGEGDYDVSERVIQELLMENGATGINEDPLSLSAAGIEAAPSRDVRSPETYIGSNRAERFASRRRSADDSRKIYTVPAVLSLNDWGISGPWHVGPESAVLNSSPGEIVFRFFSRDLHLVLDSTNQAVPIRFKVKLDGAAPGNDCGTDTSSDGSGAVREPRLYQLIRQKGQVKERTFEIDFLDPGVQAFSFTFG
jgi:thiol-disulfide isomerase/thioredoxin